ncbi:MAG: TolC family protein [Kiritimatiellaeota bacterium]|nr:TolC family protein [Kiritimatiellota bacterium]
MQTRYAKKAAEAQSESVRSQLQQAELAASAAVWSGHQNYQTALKKVQASGALLKSAQAAYDLALDSYKAGLLNILDLLTAESQLALARSQSIGARQDAFTALANLAFASGTLDKENLDVPGADGKP